MLTVMWSPVICCINEREGAAGRLRLAIAHDGTRPVAAQFWTVEAGTSGGTSTPQAPDSGTVPAVGDGAQADTLQPAAPSVPQGPSLVAKHCASCHGQDLAAPKGKLFFDAGLALDCGPGMSAVKAVMSGKMPKGVALSPEEKGQLIQELAALTKAR